MFEVGYVINCWVENPIYLSDKLNFEHRHLPLISPLRKCPTFAGCQHSNEGASFIFGAGQKKGELGGRMVDQRALGGLDRLTTPAPMSAMTAKVRKATW